ncbi:MAG TPA: HAD family hydrolase [Anaerolineae bacterium]|jgi:putative hydrolase of the HAD superfamily|nr:HAD family hydrolase [Anaerolineae bacterium]
MIARQRRIEAVLFDLDDTLISWAHPTVSREEFYLPRVERVHAYLTDAGHTLPPCPEFWQIINQAIMAMWAEAKKSWRITSYGRLLDQVFEELELQTDGLETDQVLRVFGWAPRPGVELFPDTLPVLRTLRRQGYQIGLLTNSFLPMWMRDEELRAYDLIDLLDQRVSAADVGYLKPHPAIYHDLLNKLGIQPQNAIFVGDRPINDIAGANDVGLISVLISPSYLKRDCSGVIPDYTINRLDQLLPLVDRLQSDALPTN